VGRGSKSSRIPLHIRHVEVRICIQLGAAHLTRIVRVFEKSPRASIRVRIPSTRRPHCMTSPASTKENSSPLIRALPRSP
jgi:hypothetical protein